MTQAKPLDVVYSFIHGGIEYHIVTMASFPWRAALGFKPKWPYVLTNSKGYAVNGVSESDLDWYRQNR